MAMTLPPGHILNGAIRPVAHRQCRRYHPGTGMWRLAAVTAGCHTPWPSV